MVGPLVTCKESSGSFLKSSARGCLLSLEDCGLEVSGVVAGEGGGDSESGCEDEVEAPESLASAIP